LPRSASTTYDWSVRVATSCSSGSVPSRSVRDFSLHMTVLLTQLSLSAARSGDREQDDRSSRRAKGSRRRRRDMAVLLVSQWTTFGVCGLWYRTPGTRWPLASFASASCVTTPVSLAGIMAESIVEIGALIPPPSRSAERPAERRNHVRLHSQQ